MFLINVSMSFKKIISNHVNPSANDLNENVKTLMKLGSGLTFIKINIYQRKYSLRCNIYI